MAVFAVISPFVPAEGVVTEVGGCSEVVVVMPVVSLPPAGHLSACGDSAVQDRALAPGRWP
jgi:hypothetical protein